MQTLNLNLKKKKKERQRQRQRQRDRKREKQTQRYRGRERQRQRDRDRGKKHVWVRFASTGKSHNSSTDFVSKQQAYALFTKLMPVQEQRLGLWDYKRRQKLCSACSCSYAAISFFVNGTSSDTIAFQLSELSRHGGPVVEVCSVDRNQ